MNERTMFAITASCFSVVFLVALIVLGSHAVQTLALVAAFSATVSQYMGPDPKTYVASIYAAYASFAAGLLALVLFAIGA